MKNKLYRKPLQEQIRTAKGEIKRLWHEVKGVKNKPVVNPPLING